MIRPPPKSPFSPPPPSPARPPYPDPPLGCPWQGRLRRAGSCRRRGPCRVRRDRKSTRLNSSHLVISYAVFCLKKKKRHDLHDSQSSVYYEFTLHSPPHLDSS